jgi:hypothetical protein
VTFSVTFKGDRKLARDLEKFKKTAVPYAVRDGLNGLAFEARRVWGDEIRKTFVNRNTFTANRALEVGKAKGTNVSSMAARVGSIAAYQAFQETGGTVRGKSGHRGIPGPQAAGQAAGSHRTRVVRMTNRLGSIKAAKALRGKTRRQRNAAAMAMAKRSGQKFAVLQRPRGGSGLFVITGPKRKLKARLMWDLSRKSAHVKAHPTLGPTLKRMQPRVVAVCSSALLKQLQRHKILGY